MFTISLLRSLGPRTLWPGAVFLAIVLAEAIVAPMSFLLKDRIGRDFLITGFAASLTVFSVVAAILIHMLDRLRGNESSLQSRQAAGLAERSRLGETLWRHANYGLLTDMPNRNLFHQLLTREAKNPAIQARYLAVFHNDLGRLNEVNNALGYLPIDARLRPIWRQDQRLVLSEAHHHDGAPARHGGDCGRSRNAASKRPVAGFWLRLRPRSPVLDALLAGAFEARLKAHMPRAGGM